MEKNGGLELTPEEVSSTLAGVVPARVLRNWGEMSPQECLKLATNKDILTDTNNELEKVNTDGRD